MKIQMYFCFRIIRVAKYLLNCCSKWKFVRYCVSAAHISQEDRLLLPENTKLNPMTKKISWENVLCLLITRKAYKALEYSKLDCCPSNVHNHWGKTNTIDFRPQSPFLDFISCIVWYKPIFFSMPVTTWQCRLHSWPSKTLAQGYIHIYHLIIIKSTRWAYILISGNWNMTTISYRLAREISAIWFSFSLTLFMDTLANSL